MPAVTVAALLAGGGVALGLTQSSGGGAATAGTAGAHGVSVPSLPALLAPASPSPTASPQRPVTRRPASRPAALRLRVVGTPSWVEVTRQGTVVEQAIVRPGQRQVFRRHGLDVVLGNAGAVRISVNGRRSRPAGRIGQVVRFTVP